LTHVRQCVTLWAMEIEIGEIKWDDFNVEHIAQHDVAILEGEENCRNKIYIDETYGGRYLLVGRTDKARMISIVLVHVEQLKYYPVTARDSSRGERKKANDQAKSK